MKSLTVIAIGTIVTVFLVCGLLVTYPYYHHVEEYPHMTWDKTATSLIITTDYYDSQNATANYSYYINEFVDGDRCVYGYSYSGNRLVINNTENPPTLSSDWRKRNFQVTVFQEISPETYCPIVVKNFTIERMIILGFLI